jgi:hypothetical protein
LAKAVKQIDIYGAEANIPRSGHIGASIEKGGTEWLTEKLFSTGGR